MTAAAIAKPMSVAALRALAPADPSERTTATAIVGEIRSLNTLRGIAALMVAAYHAPMIFGVQHQLPHAYLAVDLFFVLSGFVISHVYRGRIEDGLSAARFGQLRLARLYPLLALATVAGFALWLLKAMLGKVPYDAHGIGALALNLLLAPADTAAWTPDGAAYPFCGQSWSIVWEVGLCAMFFAWTKWLGKGAPLIALAAGVVIAAMAVARGTLDGGWTYDTFWVGGLRAMFAFWAGVSVRQLVGGRIGRGAPMALWVPALVAAAAMLAYVVLVSRTVGLLDLAAVVLAFPLLIAACACTRHRLVENRLGDVLGAASYSVYMLHGLAIEVTATALKLVPPLPQALSIAFGLTWMALLVAACWLSWRFVETPLRRRYSRSLVRVTNGFAVAT